jgi:acetylornithine deacetylase/succinyl-diaminopimelate desuccinylase-like protein
VALETDEEIFDHDALGIQWLLSHHRDLIDAEFALNEGGGVYLKDGKAQRINVQTSEKVPVTFQLDVKNPGGHSSVPRRDNAIYHLAEGLVRLSKFEFPMHLNDTTRAWFARVAETLDEKTAADIRAVLAPKPDEAALARLSAIAPFNATLRTTCVATTLEGGHAANALPQLASAKVNCRIMPGEPAEEVKATLIKVLADSEITVTQIEREIASEPSKLNEEIVGAIEKLSHEFWPEAAMIPVMSSGATDGAFLRNAGIPTYGHSGMAMEAGDSARLHGRDERVPIKSFYQGNE